MNTVVQFYRKGPPNVVINGEQIPEAAIAEAMIDYADAPKPREAAVRSLVVRTLLRQRAVALQIEAETEEAALEKVLEREVEMPPVSDEEIRRYFDGNRKKFRSGDLFEVRHILFDTKAGDSDPEVLKKAERALFHLKNDPASFERVAREESICSSSKTGGQLGQISEGAVVPEFWSALTAFGKTGLLPQLVESRFGHHVVQVDRVALGQDLPFEAVEARIRAFLAQLIEQRKHQEYLARLIEQSDIRGVDLSDQKQQPAGPGLPAE